MLPVYAARHVLNVRTTNKYAQFVWMFKFLPSPHQPPKANVTNILQAAFLPISLRQKITYMNCK